VLPSDERTSVLRPIRCWMLLQLSGAVRGVPQRFVGRHIVGPVGSAEF